MGNWVKIGMAWEVVASVVFPTFKLLPIVLVSLTLAASEDFRPIDSVDLSL